MPKLAANLNFLYLEHPLPDRFAAAAANGFRGVEYQTPYDDPAADVKGWLDSAELAMVLINMPAGDPDAGERGLTCLPDRIGEFRDAVGLAGEYAKALTCPLVHLVAGRAPEPGPERAAFEDTYRANLVFAADALAAHGIKAVIEPINGKRDVPGFFLQTTGQALSILDELAHPNLALQFDCYHVQIMEGDLVTRIRDLADRIAHVQIANPPDRHEPDAGETDYGYVLRAIDEAGYGGWVGAEYRPRAGTAAGLGWGAAWGLTTDS